MVAQKSVSFCFSLVVHMMLSLLTEFHINCWYFNVIHVFCLVFFFISIYNKYKHAIFVSPNTTNIRIIPIFYTWTYKILFEICASEWFLCVNELSENLIRFFLNFWICFLVNFFVFHFVLFAKLEWIRWANFMIWWEIISINWLFFIILDFRRIQCFGIHLFSNGWSAKNKFDAFKYNSKSFMRSIEMKCT